MKRFIFAFVFLPVLMLAGCASNGRPGLGYQVVRLVQETTYIPVAALSVPIEVAKGLNDGLTGNVQPSSYAPVPTARVAPVATYAAIGPNWIDPLVTPAPIYPGYPYVDGRGYRHAHHGGKHHISPVQKNSAQTGNRPNITRYRDKFRK